MGKRGRKPMYDNVDEMQEKIDAYFRECDGKLQTDEAGKPVLRNGAPVRVGKHPPTMTGLALALGFATRQSICNYRKKAAFEWALTAARSRVEMYTEERLFDRDGAQGAMFSLLRNFGWGAEKKQKESETAWQKILCKRKSTKARMALWKQGGIWRTFPWPHPSRGRAAVCAPQA